MKSSFFIVADRANLKAFKAEKSVDGRPPRLQLFSSHNFTDGVANMQEKNEDAQGGFPVCGGPAGGNGGGSRHQNSSFERHYDIEYDRRAVKHIVERISDLLREEHPDGWSFAVPSDIKNAVLEGLNPQDKKTLNECVAGDLVKVSTADLLDHFSAVRAA